MGLVLNQKSILIQNKHHSFLSLKLYLEHLNCWLEGEWGRGGSKGMLRAPEAEPGGRGLLCANSLGHLEQLGHVPAPTPHLRTWFPLPHN